MTGLINSWPSVISADICLAVFRSAVFAENFNNFGTNVVAFDFIPTTLVKLFHITLVRYQLPQQCLYNDFVIAKHEVLNFLHVFVCG